ncbi:nucleotide exchange factor GrpE [Metamycoplasma neophronis]|uniref:Protein GrpE n=1 Tax=Metamycoplasma neophronis TaxID=872983 RepID=A0ABY2Z0U8_9BACT|nr:nucleotide exchange factor GrpE [Metamycoplasma neophronis]TPR53893.1 nucleotide exchange factor GrpE [Metamycoplasma neophronis]
MSKIFKKYDNVEIEILSESKLDSKKQTGFIGFSGLDENVEKALENGKYEKDTREISFKTKGSELRIKVLKHIKTPKIYHFLFEKNQELANEFVKDQLNVQKLNSEIDSLKTQIIDKETEFKKQIVSLQEKAQLQINEHRKRNDEHINNQIKENKQYALQSFLEDLIQPLNNFEVAIKSAENIDNPIVQNFAKGFDMLYKQIENVLADAGVSKIEPKIGDTFDPNIHQVYEVFASDQPKDTILEVKNIGYKLHDRTIKPALIVVSK